MPAFFLNDKDDDGDNDNFEVFANEEKTRFVSINVTRGLFRIVHCEMFVLKSEWQPTHTNFEFQAVF